MKSVFLSSLIISAVFCFSAHERDNTNISSLSIPSEINELTENQISSLTEEELLAKYDVPKDDPSEKKTSRRSRKTSNQFKRPESNNKDDSKLKQVDILAEASLPPKFVQDLPKGVKSLLSSNISIEIKQEIIANLKEKLKTKNKAYKIEKQQPTSQQSLRRRFSQRNKNPKDKPPKESTAGSPALTGESTLGTNKQTRYQKTAGRNVRQKINPTNGRNARFGLENRRGRKENINQTESVDINSETGEKSKKRRTQNEEEAIHHRERSVINPFQSKVDTFNKTKKARGPLYRIKPRYGEPKKASRILSDEEQNDKSNALDSPVDLLENPTELDPYIYFGNNQQPQPHRKKVFQSSRVTRRTRGQISSTEKTTTENEKDKKESVAKDMTSLHFPSRHRKKNKDSKPLASTGSKRGRSWHIASRNRPTQNEKQEPKIDKEINEEPENKSKQQSNIFDSKKYKHNRGSRMKSAIDQTNPIDDKSKDKANKYGRRGKSALQSKELQKNSKFIFLGTGRTGKGKILEKTEESNFPHFHRGNGETNPEIKTPRPNVSHNMWSQNRQRNKNKLNNQIPPKTNKSEDEREKELLSRYDVLKAKTTERNTDIKLKLPKNIENSKSKSKALSKFSLSNLWTQGRENLKLEEILNSMGAKSYENTKTEPVKPFLHLTNPLEDDTEKKNSNFEDLKRLLYSDESDQTNTSSVNQKRHYVYPPLHYKSSLHFSKSFNHNNDLENMTNKEKDEIVIPNLVLGDERQHNGKTEETQSSEPMSPRMNKSFTSADYPNENDLKVPKISPVSESDPDLALALKLVKTFRAFRDLHKNRTNLHSDLKQFLLEMSNMFK